MNCPADSASFDKAMSAALFSCMVALPGGKLCRNNCGACGALYHTECMRTLLCTVCLMDRWEVADKREFYVDMNEICMMMGS